MNARRASCRIGFSMVEMLVVIVIGAILFGITTVLLAGVFQASAGNTNAVARQQTLLRLAHAWRADVNGDRAPVVSQDVEDENTDRFAVHMGNVGYHAGEDAIYRTTFRFAETLSRESFPLEDGESATFHIDEETGAATIRFHRVSQVEDESKVTFEIVAAVGSDLRYQ